MITPPKKITTRVAIPDKKYVCPYCRGQDTNLLPGGVVVECLNMYCYSLFNKEAAEK